jgi:putative salt-induced outer membrane protein
VHYPPARLACIAAALALSATVSAETYQSVFDVDPAFPTPPPGEDEPAEGRLLGHVTLGFSATSGNTETTTLNFATLLGYEVRQWRHAINLMANRTSDAEQAIAERYVVAGKSDYKIGERDYLFVTAQGERDRFAGFSRRTSQAVGYGRELLDTDRHKISAEIGGGARQTRFVDDRSENDAILRLAGGWLWRLSEATEFSQRLIVETGEHNTYSEAVSSLKTNLIGSIYSNLSFTIKRNDTVPEGRRKTDTFTSVQFEYRF